MWKHVCDNANVRIWWIVYIYMVMWNVHAVKWRHRFENEKNMDSVIRMPDLVMRICVIGNVWIRARWICPYAWRGVRNQFRGGRGELTECSHPISWVLREHSPNVRNVFAVCLIYIRKIFATCWLSECYILTEQKGGFCIAKVWMDKNRVLHF